MSDTHEPASTSLRCYCGAHLLFIRKQAPQSVTCECGVRWHSEPANSKGLAVDVEHMPKGDEYREQRRNFESFRTLGYAYPDQFMGGPGAEGYHKPFATAADFRDAGKAPIDITKLEPTLLIEHARKLASAQRPEGATHFAVSSWEIVESTVVARFVYAQFETMGDSVVGTWMGGDGDTASNWAPIDEAGSCQFERPLGSAL